MRNHKKLEKEIIESSRSRGRRQGTAASNLKYDQRVNKGLFNSNPDRYDYNNERMKGLVSWSLRRDFRDKLGILDKWLTAHNGCHVDDVRSKLYRSIDGRTMAGWHFREHLYDYLTPLYEHRRKYSYRDSYINASGIVNVTGERNRVPWRSSKSIRMTERNRIRISDSVPILLHGRWYMFQKQIWYLVTCVVVDEEGKMYPDEKFDGVSRRDVYTGLGGFTLVPTLYHEDAKQRYTSYYINNKLKKYVRVTKIKQLSSKELRDLNLKNGPQMSDHLVA